MFSFWIIFLCTMATVMGRCHGGDGFGDDQPGGFGRGHHEEDPIPPPQVRRRTRGSARNKKLQRMIQANGGKKVKVAVDRRITFAPTGEEGDAFVREVGMFIWENIPMGVRSWENVSEALRDMLWTHLADYFDFDAIDDDPQRDEIWSGLDKCVQNLFRYRKAYAKRKYNEAGGDEDIERIRTQPPPNMTEENWNNVIDFFQTSKFQNVSKTNKGNRGKQVSINRGGTSSYSSFSYKKNVNRVEAYKQGRVDRDGKFASREEEAKYEALVQELGNQTMQSSSSNPDEISIFENVLGERRGHYRGLGPKPCGAKTRSCDSSKSKGKRIETPPKYTQETLLPMFMNPDFQSLMKGFFGVDATIPPNLPNPSNNLPDDGNDDDGDDENDSLHTDDEYP